MHKKRLLKRRAITLVEVLIDAAILSLLSMVIITSLLGSLKTAGSSVAISAAGQLANEKMEILRNMSYDALATAHGPIYPQGTILDDENVTRDGKALSVHTEIQYVDDPYDNLAPTDLNPADYKKVTLQVKDSITNKQLAVLSSNIASHAAETTSNTGVLRVTVLNASGLAVPNATVSITNATLVPILSITTDTDANGMVMIPNLPIKSGYHVSASLAGYSSDATISGSSNPTPINPDATVLLQQVTTATLNIDATATVSVTAVGLTVPSINALFKGQKLIGTNPNTIKTSTAVVITPSTTINAVEYDSYSIVPPAGWFITTCDPMQPFAVGPGTSIPITCTFSQDVSDPQIVSITPRTVSATAGVTLNITGASFTATPQISIQQGSNAEIPIATLVVGNGFTTLDGTVDFSSVPSGVYNVIIRTSGGKLITQVAGLTVQ